jgi:uncharacterized protein YprB with RNaseH-like and TPR domain
MLSELAEVRRKLRKRGAGGERRRPADPIVYRRDVPRSEPPVQARRRLLMRHVELAETVDGVELEAPCGGRCFAAEQRLVEVDEGAVRLSQALRERLQAPGSHLRRRLSEVAGREEVGGEDLILLDVETAGLGSAPLFLIGTMEWVEGEPIARQYLARNYSEEAAVTSLFVTRMSEKQVLVSFNGKSFDLPFVRARAAANGIAWRREPAHFDLLHESRRVWKDVLPDCKLQTLERRICGRMRAADIPGEEIPEAYHAFVRTNNAAEIVQILRHNLLDLVTLADLMVRLAPPR